MRQKITDFFGWFGAVATGTGSFIASFTLNDVAAICGIISAAVGTAYAIWRWVKEANAAKAKEKRDKEKNNGGGIVFLFAFFSFILAGCVPTTGQTPARLTSFFGGADGATSHIVAAPEDAKSPTSHNATKTVVRHWVTPSTASSTAGTLAPLPTLLDETVTESTTVTTGTSYHDNSRELSASFAALSPLIWIGGLLIPLGAVVGYLVFRRGWPGNALVIGGSISGSGVAIIVLANWLPRINPLWGLAGLTGMVIAGYGYYAYNKGSSEKVSV